MGKKSREKAERRDAATSATPARPAQPKWTARQQLKYSPASAPLDELRAVVAKRDHLDVEIRERAQRLRRMGYSWALIGEACGITRQSAQARFGGNP